MHEHDFVHALADAGIMTASMAHLRCKAVTAFIVFAVNWGNCMLQARKEGNPDVSGKLEQVGTLTASATLLYV